MKKTIEHSLPICPIRFLQNFENKKLGVTTQNTSPFKLYYQQKRKKKKLTQKLKAQFCELGPM